VYIVLSLGAEVPLDEVQPLLEAAILRSPAKRAVYAIQYGVDSRGDYGLAVRHVPESARDVEATVTSPVWKRDAIAFEEDEVCALDA
jgi:hypothetical protein